ncbi:DUF4136 domain-containing protein [Vibrio ezurae]|uniref:DUF4136 domain-containing protein n=1 Tax=Vibrio ezurae NBRC 102218 TaxID=1219080 RepID=U3CP38_9VIBR|nr:DUF4136 domain-containing protein [Vibrio ezurae]GAD79908.1 hypothetical protein VEZ01S_21_00310 [Vibrio ezurae NBRC 102218]
MKRFITIAFTLLLSACTTTTPQQSNNFAIGIVSSGDFQFIPSGAKTYAWHPQSGQAYIDENADKASVQSMFNQAIGQSLAEKGYIRVPMSHQPNFIVGYGVAIESELSDDELFNKTHLATGIPAQDFGDSDQKGTIVIAMYTYPLMELRWHSLAQAGAKPSREVEHIKGYVDSILKEMPSVN